MSNQLLFSIAMIIYCILGIVFLVKFKFAYDDSLGVGIDFLIEMLKKYNFVISAILFLPFFLLTIILSVIFALVRFLFDWD